MTSITEQSATLINWFRQSALHEEPEEQPHDKGRLRREQLVAQLAALPDLDKLLAPLTKECQAAERALRVAEQTYNYALMRAVMARTDREAREATLVRELEHSAPEFLRVLWWRLERMRTNLRHCAHIAHDRLEPGAFGALCSIEDWNFNAIAAARGKVENGQEELRKLMRRIDLTLPELQKRANDIFCAVEQEAAPLLDDFCGKGQKKRTGFLAAG